MYKWEATILRPEDTLHKAIQVIDQEALRIVMVADENSQLLGTVTDGDIRRALIKGLNMDSHLDDVMFKEPTVASIEDNPKSILLMMQNKGLLQVPIVDSNGKIVGLETLQKFLDKKQYDNPVFLMAGGFGKRLQPLTNDTPKPLLKVGDKPILEIILEQVIESGFHNFYISVHYKADMIRKYFGNGDKWGVSIQYVHEEEPLGTAGALGLLPKDIQNVPILMMNGDLLTKINFERLLAFHNQHDGVATMGVREYDFQVPYGVIKAEDYKVKSIVEKPVHKFFINAGIYVLDSSLIKQVSADNYLDMPFFLEEQIDNGSTVNMFPIHEYWLDIGQIDEYERAKNEVHNIFP